MLGQRSEDIISINLNMFDWSSLFIEIGIYMYLNYGKLKRIIHERFNSMYITNRIHYKEK